jgi:hypothetical protein
MSDPLYREDIDVHSVVSGARRPIGRPGALVGLKRGTPFSIMLPQALKNLCVRD